ATKLEGAMLDAFLPVFHKLRNELGPIIPTKAAPIRPREQPLLATVVRLEDHFNQTLPAEQLWSIAAAEDYPGSVQEGAQRVTRTITIDGNYRGWLGGRVSGHWFIGEKRPTGLYAPPGELLTVGVPPEIVKKGVTVSIGAYWGNLAEKEEWWRYPRLLRSFVMSQKERRVANGLGGLISIGIPRDSKLGSFEITIAGAVEAPFYVHGKTSLDVWRSELRDAPAPWASLASDRMILALPSQFIRNLDNPDAVMNLWDEIVDTSAQLIKVDRSRYRAERIVFDRQLLSGTAHSGYPFAAHIDLDAALAVNADELRKRGSYRFFHELGHNHQQNFWHLPGTTEATCNLWGAYLADELLKIPRDQLHPNFHPLRRQQLRNAYFDGGPDFARDWNSWTALDSYLCIQDAFGWKPFQRVYDQYNHLEVWEMPASRQRRNDEWVRRFSQVVGKNLAPHYQTLGLRISQSVVEEVSRLPEWKEDPLRKYR
ncbi:MAG: M60 family metallopeptidase, partial [Verrucomicrobiota bacterium]